MRRSLRNPVLAAYISLTCVAFAGCGSSAPESMPVMPAGIDTLVTGLAQAACDWQARCCSPIELEEGGGFPNNDECVSHATLELQKATASVRFAMAEGFITLDDAAAMDCVTQQKAQACNPSRQAANFNLETLAFSRWLQPCLPAFHGKVMAGGRCWNPAECIEGTHCARVPAVGPPTVDGGPPTASALDSVCLADQKRGGACQVNDDCDTTQHDYCRRPDLHCAARVPLGGKCGFIQAPDELGIVQPLPSPACDIGLICDMSTGVCSKPPQDGDECRPPEGLTCDSDPALALSCVTPNFSGVGSCKPAGKTGDACGASGLPPCQGGLACNAGGERGLGMCGPPPKVGEACSLDQACESPARCLSATHLCTKPGAKAAGESCTADSDCATLTCLNAPHGSCAIAQTTAISCSGAGVNVGAVGNGFAVDGGPIGGVEAGTDGFFRADAPPSFDVPPLPIFDAGVGDAPEGEGPALVDGGASQGG